MFSAYHKNIPTIDIYFREPLKQLISEELLLRSKRPIKRLGPFSFFANNKAIIIRYITDSEIRKIHALKPERCFYLIDDDVEAVANESLLPDDYRKKLIRFGQQQLPKILKLADTIVAPNRQIFNAYPDKSHLLLNPSYSSLCEDFSHFKDPATIDIVFSGTRSHLNDLLLISDAIANICRSNPHVHFTTYLSGHAPDSFQGFKNIHHKKAKPWPAFKNILRKKRFHIALAPYQDTSFNHARSSNKILDHGAFGAAGLYSNRLPLSEFIEHGKNGLLISDDHYDWQGSIENLILDLETTKLLAQSGTQLSATLGDPDHVQRFWMNQLF